MVGDHEKETRVEMQGHENLNNNEYLPQDIMNNIFSYLVDNTKIENIESNKDINKIKEVNKEMNNTLKNYLNENLEYKYAKEVEEILEAEYDSNDELEYKYEEYSDEEGYESDDIYSSDDNYMYKY